MEARWIRLCGDTNASRMFYSIIEAMYRRDGHHTLRHVAECLDLLAQVENAPKPEAMEFAIWLHDIVYAPDRADNEMYSSLFAGVMLHELHMGYHLVGSVQKLIMATRDHRAESEAEALMVDIDLSILGSDPARYDEYAGHIRKEFSSVADKLYRAARTDVLEGFLGRKSIFLTATLRERFEAQARTNLTREIEVLAHG